MTEYSAEVQQILDNPAEGDEPEDSACEVWSKLNFGDDPKFSEFWSEVIGRSGTTWTTADAATATQFKDQLTSEDYVALMTPWWKATGKTDDEIWISWWKQLFYAINDPEDGSWDKEVEFDADGFVVEDEGYPTVTDMINNLATTTAMSYDEAVQAVENLSKLASAESAPKSIRRSTLEEAANLIDGDRNKDYGEPWDNHRRIASLWAVLFGHDVTPAQVAIAMALVKVARLVHTPDHHDSFVDGAAYLAIADELAQHEA